ncbi:MAG: hypothetical protein KGH66_00805 [Candidatus Micrarchaeota archaeon]|nr:hypothetical protein [Candidatus Micrarchaeota archaeon]
MTKEQLIKSLPERWSGIVSQNLLSKEIIEKAISAFTAGKPSTVFAAEVKRNFSHVNKMRYVLRLEGLVPVPDVEISNHPLNMGRIAQKAATARKRILNQYPTIKEEFKENAARSARSRGSWRARAAPASTSMTSAFSAISPFCSGTQYPSSEWSASPISAVIRWSSAPDTSTTSAS